MTPLDTRVLATLARYYCLCRPQLQALCFPDHADGRSLRARLEKLRKRGLISKTRSFIPYGNGPSGCPVYYLTRKGANVLSEECEDESYLALNTRPPRESILFHWLAIGDTHMVVDRSAERHSEIAILKWINEWETVNRDAVKPQQFTLQTVFSENPRLSCSPDAGFLLEYEEYKVAYYLEQDRNTSGADHIAASKTRGYAELARTNGHKRHFPETNVDRFRVLMVTTHRGRRKALQRAMRHGVRSDLWLFVCTKDFTPENFPFGDVFHDCNGEAGPLIRKRKRDDGEATS